MISILTFLDDLTIHELLDDPNVLSALVSWPGTGTVLMIYVCFNLGFSGRYIHT